MTNTTRCQVLKKKKRHVAKGATWVGFDTYEAGAFSVSCLGCLRHRTRSTTNDSCLVLLVVLCRTAFCRLSNDLQDGLSWVVFMASLRDIWVSLMIWSAQRSGGRPLGRRHDEGGVEARMSIAWVPVVDGICVRRHLDAVCGLLSLS